MLKTLLVGWQEGHPSCKNWVVGRWRGYLSGARCGPAHGPANATAAHCLLPQQNPDWLIYTNCFLHLFRAFVSLADAIYENNLKQAFLLVLKLLHLQYTHTHTHTHLFNGPLSGTTRVSWYQKGKTNLDFTEARDSEWQRHQLGHMQVRTRLQTDNHASTPPLVVHRADALPAAQPTASKHWRQ